MAMPCSIDRIFALIRNPLINSKGMHTSALFGFINQIMKLITKDKPDLMVAAFDSSKKLSDTKNIQNTKPQEKRCQKKWLRNFLIYGRF